VQCHILAEEQKSQICVVNNLLIDTTTIKTMTWAMLHHF